MLPIVHYYLFVMDIAREIVDKCCADR
jgi:hypothetical protein